MSETNSHQLAEHYFRKEYARMVSVITPYFGLQRINLAEDVVQDTLLEALHNWEFKGLPPNPSAWLYTVAKNKALNLLKKESHQVNTEVLEAIEQPVETLFSEERISDDQLRMMFACCHPKLTEDAQVCLTLKTLCGMSISEISKAFVTSNETINKRLVRARKALKAKNVTFDLPSDKALETRLSTVLKTIMLLFNEGYSASKGDQLIRYELCLEAIRLTQLICDHPQFQKFSSPNALLALMLLNASRFKARVDAQGHFVRMVHQDRSLWDQRLIARGLRHLEQLEDTDDLSPYHLMATISAYHCTAKEYGSTNWQGILNMYELLLTLDNSPLVQLNRSIALSRVKGTQAGIDAVLAIAPQLPEHYHLLHSTLADLYFELGDYTQAIEKLQLALQHTDQPSERQLIQKRIAAAKEKLK